MNRTDKPDTARGSTKAVNPASQFRRLRLASCIALVLAASSPAFAENPNSQNVLDARQESQIATTYALSPYLRDNDLQVSVLDGKATVRGTVEESTSKDLATQIAMGVKGIKEVDNQIQVQPGYLPPKQEGVRGFGRTIDDASITAAVKSKLLWSKYTEGLSTNVETTDGKVTLRGTATSADARKAAGRMAETTQGVYAVDNGIQVKAEQADSASATGKSTVKAAGQGISDSWITTKVKSTLLYSSNVSSSEIAVSTRNGIVTLSGVLGSRSERNLAIELASNVRGVIEVQAKGLKY
ncbi:transport-associated [Pseudomonas knackmussii B13]|uniref:Transport-associated n=1 Tax=Pseudomonas knackmussii (strain DSM 6978 / CCUG 54928 / LMG 23759 / B13) TaxID=1301098 RepID=A0A024HQ43_PSEKB|nr:BON domain-containing protein [Pseudomonas knackmussii]CDF86779.1 transport-associated [Pseudomonas knackmussii B13]